MCSTFNQNLQRQDLSRLIENILGLSDVSFSKSKIFPGKPALALKSDESHKNVCAEMMRFSLIPRWAKEPKLKFATHNARLETVLEKATWKDAFSHRHCLIPISGFIEPIYEGSLGGNMVEFQAKEGILFAAGIWEEWNNKVDGEVITSFSILTSDP
jgi:putative SOS response-associated peptidase YedK